MEARIGVFVCSCGNSLNNIDFAWLKRRVPRLSGVACTRFSTSLCLKDELAGMISTMSKKQLDRVVIAGCSPQFKGHVFTNAMNAAGIDQELVCWANLREQCAFAHEGQVNEKALGLIKTAVKQASLRKPVKLSKVRVNQQALIVGGGFSGLTVATELSKLGIGSTLVEKEPGLGGRFKSLGILEPSLREALDDLIAAASADPNVRLVTSAKVTSIEGTAGKFSAEIAGVDGRRRSEFGAIVVASGREAGRETEPGTTSVIAYQDPAIEKALARFPRRIAFLTDESSELTRASTLSVLSGALAVRQKLGSEVYVLTKGLKVDSGGYDELYRDARQNGIVFVTFEEVPEVITHDGHVSINMKDIYIREDIVLECDLLIVNRKTSSQLASPAMGIKTDSSGLYQEVNPHLFLSLSERKGVFLAGSCRADIDMSRARLEATEAAMKVYELLKDKTVDVPVRVRVEEDKCRACLTCFRACPHNAIVMQDSSGKQKASVSEFACDACGVCAAVCPAKAIEYEGFTDEQILVGLS